MTMQSIEKEIVAATGAVNKVTSENHIDYIVEKLRSSRGEFALTDGFGFQNGDDRPGIYLIEIKLASNTELALGAFVDNWNLDQPKCNSLAYRKRAQKHLPEKGPCDFLPLYLGKGMNVRKRLTEHLTGKADSSTYGLKLLARADVLNGCTLKANWVTFEVDKKGYFCIELLEAALRRKLHPIVGKQ
jgi:hypothetical protein